MFQITPAQIEVFRNIEYSKIVERLSLYCQENHVEKVEAMGAI